MGTDRRMPNVATANSDGTITLTGVAQGGTLTISNSTLSEGWASP